MRSPVGALLAAVTNRSPVPYVGSQPGRLSHAFSGTKGHAELDAMGTVGTLFAIVDRISEAVSQAEWKLYRTAASGNPDDRTEVTRHLALDVWNNPNPFYTRQVFVETTLQHFELTGEGRWLVARDKRSPWPNELWPMRPDRVEPVPHPTDFLSGYVYNGPDGEKIPLGLNEVIWVRRPNPSDPYRGIGPVQALLADLDATRYSAEWNRNFFLNSAEPGGIIQMDETLTDARFNELRDRWNEQHRGINSAHRVAILEQGQWVDRKFTQRDMQFAELRSVSREVIREAFAFPKPLLGSVDDVNRANAEAGEVVFARWLVKSRLERLKQALNAHFLPLFGSTGQGVEFDYCNPVPPDRDADNAEITARSGAARDLVEAGFYAPEVLEAVGLPEMSFGQPDADPKRELLIDLVKGAPTLAPLLLPMLGYELPEDAVQSLADSRGTAAAPPAQVAPEAPAPAVENAMRWVAVCKDDDDSCQPCRDNDGHTYRNRADAYDDYPGGAGYVDCLGRDNCRCTVVKRRKGND